MTKRILIFATGLIFLSFSCSKDDDAVTDDGIRIHSNVRIGNQNNNEPGSFINLSTGEVYTFAEAFNRQQEIDLVFLHDSGFGAVVSPAWVYNNYPNTETYLKAQYGIKFWNNPKHTELDICEEETPTDFAVVSNIQQLKNLWNQCGMVMGVAEHDIKKDDIIRFNTAENKKGVLKINKVVGNESTSGYVEIDIKIQK